MRARAGEQPDGGGDREPERGAAAVKALAGVVGAALTVLLVSSTFVHWHFRGPGPLVTQRFPLREFFADLPGHLPWLVPFAGLTALMFPARALQWQWALRRRVPFKERYHLVAIGGFCNNALPGKLGDVIRAFLLARSQRIPFVEALGSVAVCKLLEFAALMLLVAVSFLGPFGATMSRFAAAAQAAVAVCLGLVAVVVLLAHHSHSLSAWLEARGRFPKAQMFLVNVGAGLGTARSLRGMAKLLLFSVPPVLAPAIGYGLGLSGLGIRGGVYAGAVVLVAIALGQSAIGVPAGTGIYYFVTSWSARSLGATEAQAAAYAALTHLATIATQLGMGAVSVWVRKIKLSDLRRRKDLAAEAVEQVVEREIHSSA
ncbi:MAG TPA: lysylphosphatidylglycerol synthase transmembrane domain-containing protein [Myxococcales bacterium]|nr:lysylphosphatidylglycerol synthase transmembrane domain-containing protein [Myxococcales bacterium]